MFNRDNYENIFGNANTIAIVGSGTVEPDSTEHINNADIVIRFNDFNRRKNFTVETATQRCDVLFTHYDIWPITKQGYAENIKSVVIAIPYPFNCERIIQRVEDTSRDKQIYMVNPYIQSELCALLKYDSLGYQHPSPTVGMTCLFHLTNIISLLENKPSLYITGFDWHVDFDTRRIDQKPIFQKQRAGHWNHFYAEEGRWAVKNLLGNALINLSDRSKKALETIKEVNDKHSKKKSFIKKERRPNG